MVLKLLGMGALPLLGIVVTLIGMDALLLLVVGYGCATLAGYGSYIGKYGTYVAGYGFATLSRYSSYVDRYGGTTLAGYST